MNNTSGIPRIGIVPYQRKNGARYLPQGYVDAIEMTGSEVVVIDYAYPIYSLKGLVVSLDAVIFSGGGDIDPGLYGQTPERETAHVSKKRDQLELALFDLCYPRNLPVLGICRGMQLINVALGGTLVQHVPSRYKTDHATREGCPPTMHTVAITKGSRLESIVKAPTLFVNSYHHQAVDAFGDGLVPSACAEDGVCEALELPGDRFFVGVQWHPEKSLASDDAKLLFAALRNAIV